MGAIIKLEIKRAIFIRFRPWPYAGDGADDAQALQDEKEDAVRLAHVVGMLVEQRAMIIAMHRSGSVMPM